MTIEGRRGLSSILVSTASVLACAWMLWQVTGSVGILRAGQRDVLVLLQRIANMAGTTATATWTSGGIEVVVSTERNEGEDPAVWAARHRENVDAMLQLFPKDP